MSHTVFGVVSQGGITAIDLSPTSEDIIASAGRDHTVQIYDRFASQPSPICALHIVWHIMGVDVTCCPLCVVYLCTLVHSALSGSNIVYPSTEMCLLAKQSESAFEELDE